MQDLYAVSGTSPTLTDSPTADCEMFFYFRVRTAPVNSNKRGRWIKSREFSTLEAAEQAAHTAARELAMRARCRAELEVLGVVEW